MNMIDTGDVVITGIGAISPFGIGVAPMLTTQTGALPRACGIRPVRSVDPHLSDKRIRNSRTRRLDKASLAVVAAAAEAIRHSGYRVRDNADETGIILGSRSAGLDVSVAFLEQLRDTGVEGASPMLFTNTILNAPVGHLAIQTGIRGPGWMVSGDRGCGIAAFQTALEQLALTSLKGVVTGGVAIHHPLLYSDEMELALEKQQLIPGEGAYVLFLETRGHALERRAPFICLIRALSTTTLSSHAGEQIRRFVLDTLEDAQMEVEDIGIVVTASPAPDLEPDEEFPVLRSIFKKTEAVWFHPNAILGYSEVSGIGGLVQALGFLTTDESRSVETNGKRKATGAFILMSDGLRRLYSLVVSLSDQML